VCATVVRAGHHAYKHGRACWLLCRLVVRCSLILSFRLFVLSLTIIYSNATSPNDCCNDLSSPDASQSSCRRSVAVFVVALDRRWCWIALLLLTAVRVSRPVRSQGRRREAGPAGSWPRVPSMAASNWVIGVNVLVMLSIVVTFKRTCEVTLR